MVAARLFASSSPNFLTVATGTASNGCFCCAASSLASNACLSIGRFIPRFPYPVAAVTLGTNDALVERSDESSVLRDAIALVSAGTGRLVLIEGPAGIGKTA